MNVDAYLDRIGYSGSRQPNAETLRQLHRAHMLTVPFENLDIPLGNPIELVLPLLFDKIVNRRRGGFCYELNGLFAWLLRELGFDVEMLSAQVFSNGTFNAEFDHMLLCVAENQIADVGFGDSFVEPLPFDQIGYDVLGRAYCLVADDSDWILQQQSQADWETQYKFTLQPRELDDFRPMCHYHQTSPHSGFTQKSICSLATTTGRITLSNNRLITTTRDQRQEEEITTKFACAAVLDEQFGIVLDETELSRWNVLITD